MLDRVGSKVVGDAELDVAMVDMGVAVDGEVTFQTFEKWYVATHDDGSQIDGNVSHKKSDRTDTREADGADLSYLLPSRMLLEDLYDTKILAYMVLYYEYVIRHDLRDAAAMNNTLPAFEAGPSDMAAQILQFGRQFMLDFGDDKRMVRHEFTIVCTDLVVHTVVQGLFAAHSLYSR